MIKINPGTIVKISDEGCTMKGEILGWYRVEKDVRAHLFSTDELYGLFIGNPIISNGVYFYEVLIGDQFFLFSENQLNQFQDINEEEE